MRHIKFLLICVLLAGMSLAIGCTPVMSTDIQGNVDKLIGYYDTLEELDEWEALGLKNLGVDVSKRKIYFVDDVEKEQPSDYALAILGNLAINNQAAVEWNITKLQNLQIDDGSDEKGRFKFSDTDTLNNTIWAVIALETAKINGYENVITYDRDKAVSYLARSQLDDGSFNGSGWWPDTDSTAHAIMALSYDKAQYQDEIDKAIDYIERNRSEVLVETDGPYSAPSVDSTAAYIEALIALNDPVDQKMIEKILEYQLEDGSFYFEWEGEKESNRFRTRLVLNALADFKNNQSKYHTKFTDVNDPNPDPEDSNEPTPQPGTNPGNNSNITIITPIETVPVSYTEIILTIRTPDKYVIKPVIVKYSEPKTVYNLLLEVLDNGGVQYKARSGYVSEIDGLKERQSGYPMSGWLYLINGEVSSKGSNSYYPTNGEKIEWVYTLDGGKDITSTLNDLEGKVQIEEIEMTEKDKIDLSAQPNIVNKVKLNPDLKLHFNDLDFATWAKQAIEVMAGNNIIYGTGNGFEPNRSLTRAELIALLLRIKDTPVIDADTPFADINADTWYHNVIATAVSTGLVSGSPGSSFNPNQPATRNDLAFYLTKSDKAVISSDDVLHFKDSDLIPSWVKKSVTYVSNKGYLNGYPDGTFRGSKPLTRAEAAVSLYSYINS